jgi:hypothetical protein
MTEPPEAQACEDRRVLVEAIGWARRALTALARTSPALDERDRSSVKAIALALGRGNPRIMGALVRAELSENFPVSFEAVEAVRCR